MKMLCNVPGSLICPCRHLLDTSLALMSCRCTEETLISLTAQVMKHLIIIENASRRTIFFLVADLKKKI